MPDDELRRAGRRRGRCATPEVLEAQVRRMLQDRQGAGAGRGASAASGCSSARLESVDARPRAFPDFDDYLRLSMRQETELFFDSIVREDRSILDFLDGKYTFLNERLARHYGIAGRQGPRVPSRGSDGHARAAACSRRRSVLTVSSYATRTSPVLRGKWVLENLLNAPPPDPPPDVPRLDEAKVGAAASLRAADGGASHEPDLRVVPRAHGSARLRPRELRRASAPGGRWTASSPIDAAGRAARRPHVRRARRSCSTILRAGPRRLRARASPRSC